MAGVRRDLAINTEGLRVFAKQMKAISVRLGSAERLALKAIGEKVAQEIRSSTAPPFSPTGANDSKGIPGRKRRSIKTSATQRGVALYSLEPDAAVWEYGGQIEPRGAPIHIPRTQYVAGQVEKDTEAIVEGLGGVLDEMARNYAEFS